MIQRCASRGSLLFDEVQLTVVWPGRPRYDSEVRARRASGPRVARGLEQSHHPSRSDEAELGEDSADVALIMSSVDR
jgi:hypothetical protein